MHAEYFFADVKDPLTSFGCFCFTEGDDAKHDPQNPLSYFSSPPAWPDRARPKGWDRPHWYRSATQSRPGKLRNVAALSENHQLESHGRFPVGLEG